MAEGDAETVAKNDGFGLDKTARLAARRDAKEEALKVPPLDPEWPYRAEGFDPVFFRVGVMG